MPLAPQSDPTVQTFSLGNWELQSGEVVQDAYLAYKTYGQPDSPRILYPTWFTGTLTEGNEWLVSTPAHPRRALDPNKYFIVSVALFGNGESSSPSNTRGAQAGNKFPYTTMYDNVRAQRELVRHFGKEKLIVLGWSMGAGNSFQWAAQFPEMVTHAIPFCGAARTSVHNQVFIDSVRKAVVTDHNFQGGGYPSDAPPTAGLQAMGRVYAGWGFSQPFYRARLYTKPPFDFPDLDAFLVDFWEKWATSKDANNVLRHVWTWAHADISAQPLYAGASKRDIPASQGGRMGAFGDHAAITAEDDAAFDRALKGIKARVLIMPCRTDLYFPPEDSELETAAIPLAQLKVIESIYGHWAGGPGDSARDAEFLDDSIYDFLTQYDGEIDKPTKAQIS